MKRLDATRYTTNGINGLMDRNRPNGRNYVPGYRDDSGAA